MKKRDHLSYSILWILLAVQIILIFWCNLRYLPKYLDGDFAKLALHIVEMASNKSLAIPCWKYTTTAEWDCVTLFALPIYMITHKIYLSLAIGNLLITFLFTAAAFYIFNDRRTALITANLLFIPYEFGILSYFNMLFYGGSQYSIKVLVPLLLAGFSLRALNPKKENKKDLPLIAGMAGLLFLLFVTTASSGIYVCMCGVFPIAAAYVLWHFMTRRRISLLWIVTASGGLLLAGLGMIINHKIMGGTRADSLSFVTFYEYCEGYVLRALAGFFAVFGASTVNGNVYITSTYGFFLFLRIIFVLVLIAAVIASAVRCAGYIRSAGTAADMAPVSEGDISSLRNLMLLSAFFWNFLIILIADVRAGSPTFEYRYYLIGSIPALFLLAARLSDFFGKQEKERKFPIAIAYFSFLFLMLFGCYRNIVNLWAWEGDVHAEYRELVSYCSANNIDCMYIYDRSHETDICRLLSQDTMYLDVLPDGNVWVNDYYASYEGPLPASDCYLAVPSVSASFEDDEPIFGRQAESISSIGSIRIYLLKAES